MMVKAPSVVNAITVTLLGVPEMASFLRQAFEANLRTQKQCGGFESLWLPSGSNPPRDNKPCLLVQFRPPSPRLLPHVPQFASTEPGSSTDFLVACTLPPGRYTLTLENTR